MIRSYSEFDFDEIEEIYTLSKSDEFSGEAFEEDVIPLSEDEEAMDLFSTSEIYVYEEKRVCGFIGVRDNYISWLFVHPDSRRLGIAKALLSHLMSSLSGEITLNVASSNVAASYLYKSLGFVVQAERIGSYKEHPISVTTMACSLK